MSGGSKTHKRDATILHSLNHGCHNSSSDDGSANTNAAPSWSKQYLEVELENEDPLNAKSLKIFGKHVLHLYLFDLIQHRIPVILFHMHIGWKVDDRIIKLLQKMLPSLSKLQKIEWVMTRESTPVLMIAV